ncbi:hypothetical protein [Methylobacterium ajmalii]|uniref:hypothetical protein n=1 Tax=Methylobacterium ajmalii TaxID=2738439 RepID=UPI00190E0CDF|nr:hypothetical protein [Methylobacterium ajmalii]MBK3397700.1 hypothetical protein [Methylobacterium ajmalii]MBK3411695.1 hypothetical protein [Methylobacterium ajmalii]MBK3425446.1 hypothetical protein [Methylobacterium ajmalii]
MLEARPGGRLRRVERLGCLPPEGTVVDTRGGHAAVQGSVLVAVSEQAAEDLVDPAGAAERRLPRGPLDRPPQANRDRAR